MPSKILYLCDEKIYQRVHATIVAFKSVGSMGIGAGLKKPHVNIWIRPIQHVQEDPVHGLIVIGTEYPTCHAQVTPKSWHISDI